MSQIHNDDTNVDIDLGSLFFAVKKNIAKIAISALIVGVVAFVIVNIVDEQYRSEARVLIDNREPVFTDQQQLNGGQPSVTLDERGVTSQVEILKSNNLVTSVARELDLASYDEFNAPKSPSFIAKIFIGLGLISDPYSIPAEERVLKEFYERLDVYQVGVSRVIAVEFTSENPELAESVPNAMVDAFLRVQSGEKLKDNTQASAWLEPEIERLRESVQVAEARVAEYRAEKGLFTIGDTDTFEGQQLSDISAELTRVRSEKVDAEARATTVRRVLEKGENIDSIANVLDSATVQRLRENEADIRGNIADLSTTLLDGHPRMQALQSQLIDVQRQLRTEARKVLASLENEASVARLRERELLGNFNNLKANSAQAGGEEVQLRALEREAASQRELLETYLGRFRQTASRSQVSAIPPDARIISRAIMPTEAFFPKKLPIIIAAMVATFIIGSIWVMLTELFSGRALRPVSEARYAPGHGQHNIGQTRAGSKSQYGHHADLGLLTARAEMAPEYPDGDPAFTEENLVGSRHSIFDVSQEFMVASTRLVMCLSPEGGNATMGSVLLARNLSDEQCRSILVDLTIDGMPSSSTIGTSRIKGLTNLLCGETTIAETIHADAMSDVHVMARGNGNMQRAMQSAERIPLIINALLDSYDTVIVECGPTDVSNVIRLASHLTTEFVVSVKDLPDQQIMEYKEAFADEGYHDALVMDIDPRSDTVKSTSHDAFSSVA
ncbi:GumC family protein [Lentilitoribacter sp. EG35]|uniref:GumC family protein n=1 Tax=Lentilitoribacter sp. EG35 TaxID=3234192 RepID=UPI003460871A